MATRFRTPRARAILALAVLFGIALAAAGWLAFRTGAGEQAAASKSTSGGTSCARRLLADWADGRIDHTYPIACYRQAMRSLPTDLEVYSSAPEDIESALRDRILESRRTLRRQSP